MTMADTVAVMNRGVVEQLGPPASLYDHPATTFVSNFLGQSNLVTGRVVGRAGDGEVTVEVHGTKVRAPAARSRGLDGEVWVGVRPEKVYLSAAGAGTAALAAAPPGGTEDNVLPGGVVTDVSFVGVSTQYLVRLPWSQELTVFEQNTGGRAQLRAGDQVELHWHPEHTFLLSAGQDAHAGDQARAALGAL